MMTASSNRSFASTCPSVLLGPGSSGTYFIGYVGQPQVIEQMLENMFVGQPAGNYDRILDFSTAVTGNLFFVPTVDFLDNPRPPAPRSMQMLPTGTALRSVPHQRLVG